MSSGMYQWSPLIGGSTWLSLAKCLLYSVLCRHSYAQRIGEAALCEGSTSHYKLFRNPWQTAFIDIASCSEAWGWRAFHYSRNSQSVTYPEVTTFPWVKPFKEASEVGLELRSFVDGSSLDSGPLFWVSLWDKAISLSSFHSTCWLKQKHPFSPARMSGLDHRGVERTGHIGDEGSFAQKLYSFL